MDSQAAEGYTGENQIPGSICVQSLLTRATTVDYLEGLSTRSFAAVFQVDTHGDPLNMGVTARVTVTGKDVRDALSLPRQALHQKEGKPVVYVRRAKGWEPRDVRIKYLTESRAVIEGLPEGTEVALVNPDQEKNKTAGKAGPLASITWRSDAVTGQPGTNTTRFSGRGRQWLPDVSLAMQNLGARKLRALLTMLGIIFGVAAVVSMLSIGAGAQQQVLAFIEQLGVRNLIVEAKDVTDLAELRRIRKTSPGLSFKDLRVIRANVANLKSSVPRKSFTPSGILPKPRQDNPGVYGVAPEYYDIAGLQTHRRALFRQGRQ